MTGEFVDGKQRETWLSVDVEATIDRYVQIEEIARDDPLVDVTKRTVQNWVEKAAVGAAEKNGDSESPPVLGGDSSTGWLAQLEVYLYELSSGFQPQEQVVDSKP